MKFQYQAKERSGTARVGELVAGSIADARQMLREQGLFVTTISSSKFKAATDKAKSDSGLFSRVNKTDLVMVMSQLTIMCQSGVDLAEALHNVSQQCPKPAMRKVLNQVDSDVSSGTSFSDALRKHPRVFDELFVASISAGEQSGTITQVLERLTNLIRGDMRLRSSVWSMLMYPIVLGLVTFVVLNALIFFVLPQFAIVFETLEKPVPPLTQFLLDVGAFFSEHSVLVIGSFLVVVVGAYKFRNASFALKAWDYTTLHLALVRNATRALLTGRSLRLLGAMLMSGVPLVEGIRLCRSATKNGLFRHLFEQIEHDVLQGEGIGKPLLAATFLPNGAAQMVVTAEKSGKMGEVLKNVGEYYEDEGERSLRELIKVAEPAVIVVLGIMVAVIVLSIIVPMLDVSTSSH